VGREVFGSVLLGLAAGAILNYILRRIYQPERALAFAIGTMLLVIASAASLDMDVILATMTTGVTLANLAPVRSKELFRIVRNFASPIYVVFFVLVGARLGVSAMPGWLWVVVALYVVLRTAGKMAGTYVAAKAVGADAVVRRYGGLGLFAQGGVAVGLSIMAAQRLGGIAITGDLALGDMVIATVTATTLVVQLIGPPMVKLAIRLADESGRNVTEEDVMAQLSVGEVMTRDTVSVDEDLPVSQVLALFPRHDHLVFPVVDRQGDIVGLVTLEGVKDILTSREAWEWLVAGDVMQPAADTLTTSMPLKAALERLRQLRIEQLPVVADGASLKPVGVLDSRKAGFFLDEELVRRRQPRPVGAEAAA